MSTSKPHVSFHTPSSSDLTSFSPLSKKKNLRLSEISLTSPIKPKCRKSFGTNAETDICSTKVSVNKQIMKRQSFYIEMERTREDAYGTFIIKGRKEHKVTFIDNISHQNLAEVIMIDNSSSLMKCNDSCECKCSAGCIVFWFRSSKVFFYSMNFL